MEGGKLSAQSLSGLSFPQQCSYLAPIGWLRIGVTSRCKDHTDASGEATAGTTFFAEARFHVGNDDYFLYARFGKYLASSIEHRRFKSDKISRAFTVLNKLARKAERDPQVRHILVSGPLEEIVDEPKARELARKRLSPVAQGYLEGLCE